MYTHTGPVYWGQQEPTLGTSTSSGKDRYSGVSRRNRWHFRLLQSGTIYWGQLVPTPDTSSSSGQDWSTGCIRRQQLALPPAPARTGLLGSAGANPNHFRLLRTGPVYWGQQVSTPGVPAHRKGRAQGETPNALPATQDTIY
ncbi:hypothetical protein JTE90_020501 [Oedothorax gibbosus]|uniref:Uncharacterized protein n=1 Tax=Oedothorax gibbosus TaxID=931172 RepID=A0AAV6USW2_9ARAC|nr:hypothetical protein JTE90_020501 [Oedothorax gibbosus]